MKQYVPSLLFLLFTGLFPGAIKAQNTYDQVFSLIQTHCAGAACHDGTVPTFNINVSQDSFYHEILNLTPVNPAAAANYNKILAPGDVQHCLLLRKISHGISDGLALGAGEGNYMPNNLPALANNEIELVRQWIMYGAPETGVVVDTAMINTFYRNGGLGDVYSPHNPPAPGTGFQIYYGRFFLNAHTSDTEVFYKVNPHITQNIESAKIDFMMPAGDHHFVMYLFQPGGDVQYPWGIRPLADGSMEFDEYGIGAGPGLWDFTLPPNTAFFFPAGQMLDMDLHIQNPTIDSIYACDMYINIYTEPANTTTQYMKTEAYINQNIVIPYKDTVRWDVYAQDSTRTQNWNIWKLYSHTHKYGTAFNIWSLKEDGTKGPEIYDGNYSYEDGFNVGYYRWGPHVTVRTWPNDSLFPVNPWSGLVGTATWYNYAGPDTVWWGFSSADEMQVIFFLYVDGGPLSPTGINKPVDNNISAEVFPNPVADQFIVKYSLSEPATVKIDLMDMLGNKVTQLIREDSQGSGDYTQAFNVSEYKLQPGIYLVSFDIGGKTQTQKLVVTE